MCTTSIDLRDISISLTYSNTRITSSEKTSFCRIFVPRIIGIIFCRHCNKSCGLAIPLPAGFTSPRKIPCRHRWPAYLWDLVFRCCTTPQQYYSMYKLLDPETKAQRGRSYGLHIMRSTPFLPTTLSSPYLDFCL